MNWLTFIGKGNYTQHSFIKEAKQYGITRRVSPQELKRMSWGDIVCCAYKASQKASTVVFMEFPITRISGLSTEAQAAIAEKVGLTIIDSGGDEVERGCGTYTEGATYTVNCSMAEFVKHVDDLKDEDIDRGQLMVGCDSGQFTIYEKPLAYLKNVPFTRGMRPFNYDDFVMDWTSKKIANISPIRLTRMYYGEKSKPDTEGSGHVQVVEGYEGISDSRARKEGQDKVQTEFSVDTNGHRRWSDLLQAEKDVVLDFAVDMYQKGGNVDLAIASACVYFYVKRTRGIVNAVNNMIGD
jgi:hypothetical protein